MHEYDPNRANDDTEPVAASASASRSAQTGQSGNSHRYGEQPGPVGGNHTAVQDTTTWGAPQAAPGGPPYYGWQDPRYPYPPDNRSGRSSRGGFTAGILAAALVVGGIAGVGGAAGYDALTDESAAPTSTSVVERPDTPAAKGSVEAVAASVLPSVVKINVAGPQGQGSGSGVILSQDGEILTNNHVVEVAQQGGSVSVGFNDGTTTPAEIVGTDPLTDLAIIKAQNASGLKPATLGKSGNLDVGEQVVAIGSPYGLEATVTSGIVSALHRPVSVNGGSPALDTAYPAIQTDAAINPGNSGGPLVNMQGEVVGINSSIRTASSASGTGGSIGLGFAIPLDEVLPVVDQLRAGATPTHARLGVSVTDASSNDGLVTGAGIAEVSPGSAADQAGIRRGDVVVKVDDWPIQDASSLVATIRGHRPGDLVALTVLRGDEQVELKATLDSDKGEPAS
jgi:putative serine protease PepD